LHDSLCKTTTTSKQTLLLHADGKKHRAKAKAFHASQKQKDGAEQTPDVKEAGAVPAKESAQVNGGVSGDRGKKEDKDAGKRKRMDDMTIEEPDNTKRQYLTSSSVGELTQSSDVKSENKAKSKADELASGANCKSVGRQKIKWKKIITKTLKTVSLKSLILSYIVASFKLYVVHNCASLFQNADGVMKLKKLQKLVSKELEECGVSKDKEGLRATLMDKVINHHETNLATLPAVSLPLIPILEYFVY